LRLLATFAICAIELIHTAGAFGQDSFNGVGRIVAVGDVHGGLAELVSVLQSAGVIDQKNKWIGGTTHLVQTGDCLDRGADSRKVLDLLITLEDQARKAKGRVHSLIGNHEAMNLYGDLRYVSAGEYNSFKSSESSELRDRAYDTIADPNLKNDAAYKKKWYDEHPLGWVEHRQAFGPDGRYGKLIRQRNAVIRINDYLFLHGGISQKFAGIPLTDLNKRIRGELQDFNKLQGGVAMDQDGPLWYRGLASEPEAPLGEFVDSVLKAFGVNHIVLGHTPTAGAVTPRFGGKVILIDVGLSKGYNDSPACLLVDGGKPYAIHRGKKIELPIGKDSSEYLKQAAEIDPPGTNLRKLLR
jgi:hypothetical protein